MSLDMDVLFTFWILEKFRDPTEPHLTPTKKKERKKKTIVQPEAGQPKRGAGNLVAAWS